MSVSSQSPDPNMLKSTMQSVCTFILLSLLGACTQSKTTTVTTGNSSGSSTATGQVSVNKALASFAEASGKYRLGFNGTCNDDGATVANGRVTVSATGGSAAIATCTGSVLSGSIDFDPPSQAVEKTVSVTLLGTTAQNNLLLCPKNYLAVPEDTETGVNQFCVAKFEMKASLDNQRTNASAAPRYLSGTRWIAETGYNLTTYLSYYPISVPEGMPMGGLLHSETVLLCDRINATADGTGSYRLMDNRQHLALSNHLAEINANWTSGTVGTEMMYTGQNSNILASDAETNQLYIENDTIGTGLDRVLAAASTLVTFDENNVYVGTPHNSGMLPGSGKERKRNLTMGSGQFIWDFAGNAYEWVRYIESDGTLDSNITGNSSTNYNSRTLPSFGTNPTGTQDLISSNWQNASGNLLSGDLFLPRLTASDSTSTRLGYIWIENNADPKFLNMGSGIYENGNRGGVFAFDAQATSPSTRVGYVSFRCVSNP